MTEEFLYYVWQFKLWSGSLQTIAGDTILVEKSGLRNPDAGPDFLNVRLRINDVLWAGNVEIHVRTSDWFFHNHQDDENYKKLILHVVFTHDLEELPHDCQLLILENNIPKEITENFAHLQHPYHFIPCENLFDRVDDFTYQTFIETLFIQRLQQKVETLDQRLLLLQGDWEALLFERTAYVFGLKINGLAFELMAKSFPFKILQQIIRKKENVEAFLFGQAGFLENIIDEYQFELQQEYLYLRQKYKVYPVDNHIFKFLRLRPPNFPTVRIAQLAALYSQQNHLFSNLMTVKDTKALHAIFQSVETNVYWDLHYNFGTESKTEKKRISSERIHLLLLNAIVPLRYLYGQKNGSGDLEVIFELLRFIKPEQNTIIQNFRKIGAEVGSALESQALLELKKSFCDQKKCLNCRIGNKIIQNA